LKTGLEEILLHERGNLDLKTTRIVIPDPPRNYNPDDVYRVRTRLNLSQSAFARLLYVSDKTVQGWEQGLRVPSHTAARLLQFLENPELFCEATKVG